MIDTVGQAAASFAILVVAFAVAIVIVEEWRLWLGQREVDRIRAEVARNRAIEAARGRHPSSRPAAIMRDEMDADLAADIAAQKAKTRAHVADELQP